MVEAKEVWKEITNVIEVESRALHYVPAPGINHRDLPTNWLPNRFVPKCVSTFFENVYQLVKCWVTQTIWALRMFRVHTWINHHG